MMLLNIFVPQRKWLLPLRPALRIHMERTLKYKGAERDYSRSPVPVR